MTLNTLFWDAFFLTRLCSESMIINVAYTISINNNNLNEYCDTKIYVANATYEVEN